MSSLAFATALARSETWSSKVLTLSSVSSICSSPRDTDAPLSAPRARCVPRGGHRSVRLSRSAAEAQLGERGNGVRMGGRLGQHRRLELRLGRVARADVERAKLGGHLDAELGGALAQVHVEVGAHLPVGVQEQPLRLR